MNRRQAIAAVGAVGILTPATAAADKAKVVFVGEKPVLFKMRHVTIDAVDAEKRTVDASYGPADARVKIAGLPLAADIHIIRWFQSPSIANNLPFTMDRLKELIGKQVSVLLLAEKGVLALNTVGTAND
jgi:hypothetical protein